MRVKSALWVGAYVRRVFGEGAFATIARRGADEAGAIFITIDRLNGALDLFAPAPQAAFEDADPDSRLFQRVLEAAPLSAIDRYIEKEVRFDPDIWVVAVEDRAGRAFLDLAKE